MYVNIKKNVNKYIHTCLYTYMCVNISDGGNGIPVLIFTLLDIMFWTLG